MHGDERMLGAFEDLVRLGRNYGIGVSLISQRPQSVNKEVLNMTECLFVLQVNGAQERKALTDWIVEKRIEKFHYPQTKRNFPRKPQAKIL